MRGCFRVSDQVRYPDRAFPAYAGMFPAHGSHYVECGSFPRVCGDVSLALFFLYVPVELSPRMRGCFPLIKDEVISAEAFPAYAGMFPDFGSAHAGDCGFPRVCGDVSICGKVSAVGSWLSPRMRGCFYIREMRIARDAVFPAYAGMFLGFIVRAPCRRSSPRVCGDISTP